MKCKKCGASRSWFEWLIGYPCECEIDARMKGKEKKRSFLEEFTPNGYFLMASLILYLYLVYTLTLRESFFVLLLLLSTLWACSFAKPKNKK